MIFLISINIALTLYIFINKRKNRRNYKNRLRIACLAMDLLEFQILQMKKKEIFLEEDNNKSIDILEGISILLERMCMEEVPESIEKFGVDDWYRYSNFKRFNKFF